MDPVFLAKGKIAFYDKRESIKKKMKNGWQSERQEYDERGDRSLTGKLAPEAYVVAITCKQVELNITADSHSNALAA